MDRQSSTKSYLGFLTLAIGLFTGSHAAIADTTQLQRSVNSSTFEGKITAPAAIETQSLKYKTFERYGTTTEATSVPTNNGAFNVPRGPKPGRIEGDSLITAPVLNAPVAR